jgi:hypothetical protein
MPVRRWPAMQAAWDWTAYLGGHAGYGGAVTR